MYINKDLETVIKLSLSFEGSCLPLKRDILLQQGVRTQM